VISENTMQLNALTSCTLSRELMMLSDAKHAILLSDLDESTSEFVYRWFAEGRIVSFRLPMEALLLSLDDLDARYLDAVIARWKSAPVVNDQEAEIARLRAVPIGRNGSRNEDWIRG
jgi:hypothetical protein